MIVAHRLLKNDIGAHEYILITEPCCAAVGQDNANPNFQWVMYGRRPRCKRNLTISEAFGCGHVFGL